MVDNADYYKNTHGVDAYEYLIHSLAIKNLSSQIIGLHNTFYPFTNIFPKCKMITKKEKKGRCMYSPGQ